MSPALLRYIIKRLLFMVPTLLGILLVTFTLIQFVPGGPVEQMVQMLKGDHGAAMGGGSAGLAVPGGSAAGDVGQTGGVYRGRVGVDPQKLEEIKALYGFDKPVHERFIDMVVGFLRLDLGTSFFHSRSVWELIVEKLPVSASLGLWSFLITYLVSIPMGISKAVRHGSQFDLMTSLAILVGYAIPGFVLGVIMLVFFGGGSFLQLFPLRGLTSDDFEQLSLIGKVMDYFWHLALPLTCLVLGSFAVITMLTKNTMLEEIRRQYVLTARAKGLDERTVLWRHVLRNALIPIVTGFPAAFVAAFFTGALLIETLFSLDGLGLLSYEAVIRRDYPVVMGTLFFFSVLGLLAKLVNDILYVFVDPRVQFEASRA
ncbi:MAG: microcin C ABC transporter permease YejB [Betaproteobacteria bacterium]|nr:microcin C ABC transporter permease YejB [Betaproteobacteria bacterium]